jgi:hypothetical protein
MKLLNRLFLSGLALAFVLSLGMSTANADTTSKKKKKKAEVTIVKKKRHVDIVYSSEINGGNVNGRPGYFYSDTAYTPEKGVFIGGAHAAFYSLGSQLSIPFGGAYGITKDLQVSANTNFYAGSGVSGLGNLTLGGKYAFKISNDHLKIAAGLDLPIGPLSNSGYSTVNFVPYGVGTYNFQDGFQLNGQLGIYIPGGYKIGAFSYTPAAFVQLNAGAAYPFSKDLTGIAEFDINGLGSANSPLIAGIRTGHDVQLQAFAGLDLASTVGVLVGGGVVLVSQ